MLVSLATTYCWIENFQKKQRFFSSYTQRISVQRSVVECDVQKEDKRGCLEWFVFDLEISLHCIGQYNDIKLLASCHTKICCRKQTQMLKNAHFCRKIAILHENPSFLILQYNLTHANLKIVCRSVPWYIWIGMPNKYCPLIMFWETTREPCKKVYFQFLYISQYFPIYLWKKPLKPLNQKRNNYFCPNT